MVKDVNPMSSNLVATLLAVLVIVTVFQTYQIMMLGSEMSNMKSSGSLSSGNTGTPTGNNVVLSAEQVLAEIMPTGTPEYGAAAGVTYDNVEGSLAVLAGYEATITLSGADQQRYIDLATTPGNACEFCCGIGNAGFGTSTGQLACGCSHNIAFGGLSKWLIQNTDYTNAEITEEIQKWKVLFFPKDSLERELQLRGMSGTAVLPGMVGGC